MAIENDYLSAKFLVPSGNNNAGTQLVSVFVYEISEETGGGPDERRFTHLNAATEEGTTFLWVSIEVPPALH